LLFYKPLHLEAQQVSTRIEVRRHQGPRHCRWPPGSRRRRLFVTASSLSFLCSVEILSLSPDSPALFVSRTSRGRRCHRRRHSGTGGARPHSQPLHARSAPAPAVLDHAATDSHPRLISMTSVSDLPRETLAGAVLLPCMQQTTGTTAISRRSPSNRMDGRPRTDSATAELAGEPVGPIWPRSGEARPDPAPFHFFPVQYLFY
jgi:hypothetical protein